MNITIGTELKYKGYSGIVRYYDGGYEEDNYYYGKVENDRDHLITFESDDISDIELSFQEAVDDYIESLKRFDNPSFFYRLKYNHNLFITKIRCKYFGIKKALEKEY